MSSSEKIFELVAGDALILDDEDFGRLKDLLELPDLERKGFDLDVLVKDQLPQGFELFVGHPVM